MQKLIITQQTFLVLFSVTICHLPRRLEDVLQTCLQDVFFKTSWRPLGRQRNVRLKTSSKRLQDVCWKVMKYKRYICILNWKARNQKYKTIFSKQIKSEVVIMWFTYLFVNIDAQITFGNCSELLLYVFFEFNKVSLCFYMLWKWILNIRT